VRGLDALTTLTSLCQRLRIADTQRRGWEAADVQWWWRCARASDELGQLVMSDASGDVLGAVVRTDFGRHCQLDVLSMPGIASSDLEALWRLAAQCARHWEGSPVEVVLDNHDKDAALLLTDEGYGPLELGGVDAWMDAVERPGPGGLPDGFELHSRVSRPAVVHHLEARNDATVAERLGQCSLYDPALDLCVTAPGGEVCAYGLFWADPVTKVGLVEPMRTEVPYEHRGIASHVLAVGLGLLAARGCARLKVSSDGELYTRAGFKAGPSVWLARRAEAA
jgi:predicted N-acetyltransferase YhbS